MILYFLALRLMVFLTISMMVYQESWGQSHQKISTSDSSNPVIQGQNISLENGELSMNCDEVTYENDGKKITAHGNVSIKHQTQDHEVWLLATDLEIIMDENNKIHHVDAKDCNHVALHHIPLKETKKPPSRMLRSFKKIHPMDERTKDTIEKGGTKVEAKECTYTPDAHFIVCKKDVVIYKKEGIMKGDVLEINLKQKNYKLKSHNKRIAAFIDTKRKSL
jgi:lipopolysaccharide export system protein LptA